MWFDVLKNEMRTINLPKFKIKPFGETKPDEEDNDCKDRFLNEVLKKSEQTKLIHNNPKGSPSSLFIAIDKMSEEGGFKVSDLSPSRYQDNEYIEDEIILYPTLDDGFANPDTFVLVRITEVNKQEIEQDVNEIPEEVYCKALDMINQGSPQRHGKYVEERVGDWNIRYKNRDYVMENPTGIDIRKYKKIIIRKGWVEYITRWNWLFVGTKDVGPMWKTGQDDFPIGWDTNKGVSAALDKIEEHFEDAKIEW